MSVRMRHTSSHTGNRRSHHALSAFRPVACSHCGNPIRPHTACSNCGKYNGRQVIDVMRKLTKKEKKLKEKELKSQEAGKPLDAKAMSQK